jgi:hypothetical protein
MVFMIFLSQFLFAFVTYMAITHKNSRKEPRDRASSKTVSVNWRFEGIQ